MANVIRARFQNKDGYLNINKGTLTLYGGPKPEKFDITKQETTSLLRDFLNTAYAAGKGPKELLVFLTAKNIFYFGKTAGRVFLQRRNLTERTICNLNPNTDFTKAVLSSMVRGKVTVKAHA